MIALWFSIIIICCYFIGNVNFARIFTWKFRRKDITQEGSKNPGTTNVLRTHGLGLAVLTMVFEFIKGGLPALIAGLVMEKYYPGTFYVVDLVGGLSAMLGQMFPVIYKFKGGKGVAVFVGVFFFSPLWWVALSCFVAFFLIAVLTKYGSPINLSYLFCMSTAVTVYNTVFLTRVDPYWFVVIILIWFMFLLELFMHRKNIKRVFTKTENYIDLKGAIKKAFSKNKVKK